MVQMHRSVLINMDQCARLIKEGRGKGNTELDWRNRNTALDHRALRIERVDFLAALAIVARCQNIVRQFRKDVILDRHVIGRRVAVGCPVIVDDPHIKRIAANRHGDFIDDPFNRNHALRPAKASKRGIGHQIGFAAIGPDFDIAKEISIVGMEHRTITDRGRQIGRETAIGSILNIQPANPTIIIKTDIIFDDKVMAFAGHDHVIIAIQTHFRRATGFNRNNRRQCRPL